jgi:hypothetical protein
MSSEMPEKSTQPTVQIDYIGESHQPVIVIDNLMQDAKSWVNYAASGVAYQANSQFYPGVRSPAPQAYGNKLYAAIEKVVLDTFGWKGIEITACDFSLVTRSPRDLMPIQRVPHVDFMDLDGLAVLHYLCKPEHGGTSFYRHRSTGYELIIADNVNQFVVKANEEVKELGIPSEGYFDDSNAQFERIARYESQFNRLLIYRGSLLHSANPPDDFVPDMNPASGRLTVNTFLKRRY